MAESETQDPLVIEITETPKPETPQPETLKAEVPPAPVPAKPARRSALWPVLGGVIAAGLGFGLAQVVPQGWPTQATPDPAQAQALADAVAQVATLTASVQALQAQLADASGLADRIVKLEAAPGLDTLETRLTALEARPTAQGASADPAALAGLRAEVEAMKAQSAGVVSPAVQAQLDAQVKATADKLAQIEAQARETAAEGIRQAALRQIAAALDSGAPYLRAVVDLNDLPAVIAEHAATGLPSLPSLQAAFPDAARAALEASLKADMGATWSDRVKNFLRATTGARALTPQEGTDPDAVLSRAEAALARGDLTAALAEVSALPEAGQAAMADWRAQAQLRLDAEAALAALGE
ncbi:hypothetical protein NX862_09390 [Rhodobacter sp. KR11]|uniref:COG4223 family protein n=1 Tax=Rhodobacter sp. KR11 TaxID=2974588 RepID=UPI002222C86C|nr:hypothetical protein [Rhodobacter sp. KR11]MCW1918969.1 hypothetical protein [Rhodobacter sp. KR11]